MYEIFIPDNTDKSIALERTTHLAIGAHQDDIEIMAAGAILDCFQNNNKWFTAVVVCDGANASRRGKYKNLTNEEMILVRNKEQKKAAIIGEYSALALLNYNSNIIKEKANKDAVKDLAKILEITQPEFVYIHNLADKHSTHIAVALRSIEAIRMLPQDIRPKKLLGCEVWGDLDWLPDKEKVIVDLSENENLQMSLLGIFDSQISSNRYDLGSIGRRKANATFNEFHIPCNVQGLSFSMDLSRLILDTNLEPASLLEEYLNLSKQEKIERLKLSIK